MANLPILIIAITSAIHHQHKSHDYNIIIMENKLIPSDK